MLTADLVHARRAKGVLRLSPLSDEQRARAETIATQLYDLATQNVGETREELLEAWAAITVGARERKLFDGIKKLIEDGLDFEVALDVEPVALRREIFELATARRKELSEEDRFDREALLSAVAEARGLDPSAIERGLFADLKSAHVLRAVSSVPPAAIVRGYDLEQARAVLLRAVRLTARIRGASPDAMRALFRKLKFQRLLYTVHRDPDGAFRLEIDGPFSLFESVTKYGLSLAIALPAITSCGAWEIEADVRWGKQRVAATFKLEGDARPDDGAAEDRMRDEVQTLLERFEARAPSSSKGQWSARIADEVLELPGVGLCIPDLAFTHRDTGEIVLLEVMGFWSRDAVWKRVELLEAGLSQKILFAVSSRLRVSEAVLDAELPGALYVYKGTMSPKAIEDKLNALRARKRR